MECPTGSTGEYESVPRWRIPGQRWRSEDPRLPDSWSCLRNRKGQSTIVPKTTEVPHRVLLVGSEVGTSVTTGELLSDSQTVFTVRIPELVRNERLGAYTLSYNN